MTPPRDEGHHRRMTPPEDTIAGGPSPSCSGEPKDVVQRRTVVQRHSISVQYHLPAILLPPAPAVLVLVLAPSATTAVLPRARVEISPRNTSHGQPISGTAAHESPPVLLMTLTTARPHDPTAPAGGYHRSMTPRRETSTHKTRTVVQRRAQRRAQRRSLGLPMPSRALLLMGRRSTIRSLVLLMLLGATSTSSRQVEMVRRIVVMRRGRGVMLDVLEGRGERGSVLERDVLRPRRTVDVLRPRRTVGGVERRQVARGRERGIVRGNGAERARCCLVLVMWSCSVLLAVLLVVVIRSRVAASIVLTQLPPRRSVGCSVGHLIPADTLLESAVVRWTLRRKILLPNGLANDAVAAPHVRFAGGGRRALGEGRGHRKARRSTRRTQLGRSVMFFMLGNNMLGKNMRRGVGTKQRGPPTTPPPSSGSAVEFRSVAEIHGSVRRVQSRGPVWGRGRGRVRYAHLLSCRTGRGGDLHGSRTLDTFLRSTRR